MATYQTYQLIGEKEDVSDIISNISPTYTPFQTMIGREKVHNTLTQWQEDSLADVADLAGVEGADASSDTLSPTTMRTNYTQIFTKSIKVSGTADAVSTYGRAKDTAYEMGKKSKELKRHLEHTLVGLPTQVAAVGDASTARDMAPYVAQIATANKESNAGNRTLTEALILANLETVYNAGGEPSVIMVTPSHSTIVAGFAAASGRTRDFAKGKTVVNVVDLYVSPFGEQKVVLNRFLSANETLIFNPADWKLQVLRNWFREPLAKVGDSTRHQIVGEFSLKHSNQTASGLVEDLTA